MILGKAILGKTTMCVSAIPPAKSYTSMIFTGESYIDNLHVQNRVLTYDEIVASTPLQTWGLYTNFLANFENSLNAGNLATPQPIDHWRIRRKAPTDALFTTLATIPFDNTNTEYIDYTPRNLIDYEYTLYSISSGVESLGLGGFGMAYFWGWQLTSIPEVVGATPTNTYMFDMEINTENIKAMRGNTIYQNYTKYPAFRFDDRQYESGKLSTIPYEWNGNEIDITVDLLEEIRDFINNGKEKILKDPIGQVWKVVTTDFDYKFQDRVISQPYTIEFSWTQTGII